MKTKMMLLALCLLPVGRALAEGPVPDKPKEVPQAEQVFREVAQLIGEHYVDGAPSQDALWTGAIEGALDRLVKNGDTKVNTILHPQALEELRIGLKGSLSGVGIVIRTLSDVIFVQEVIEGGPAAEAGIKGGDRILAIDNQSVRGMSLADVVGKIRGPQGATVDLQIQREAKEWNLAVTRRAIRLQSVQSRMVNDVAYLRISSFGHKSVEQLDAALASLAVKHPKGLVFDLRNCPGGLLDASIEVADRFLAKGKEIVSTRGRNKKQKVYRATGVHPLQKLPMVVLINKHTASSGEIVAAALAERGGATLVGERTFGKGTVEKLLELSNGWALKLSVARFYSPEGNSWQGKGLSPDFPIPEAKNGERFYTSTPAVDPDKDPQLKAALSILALDRR